MWHREHDQSITWFDDRGPGRYEGISPPQNSTDDGTAGHRQIIEAYFDRRRALVCFQFDRLGVGVAECHHGVDPAPAHETEDGTRGDEAAGDGGVDTGTGKQVDVVDAVEAGDGGRSTERLGDECPEDVHVVPAREGQHGVPIIEVQRSESGRVGGVVVDHQRLGEALGDLATAGRVLVDDDHLVSVVEHDPSCHLGHTRGTEDDHTAYRAVANSEEFGRPLHVVFSNHHQDVVVRLDHRVTVGDDGLTVADQGGDHPVPVVPVCSEFGQRPADQPRSARNRGSHEDQLAACELDHLRDAGLVYERQQLAGGSLARVDDEVDIQAHEGLSHVDILHPGDGALDAQFRCDVAGEHVRPVGVRHGDQQIRLLDARPVQHGRAGSVARDHQGVDAILQVGGSLFVVFDDDDVLTFSRETFGQVGPDRTCADDDDSHCRGTVVLRQGRRWAQDPRATLHTFMEAPFSSPAAVADALREVDYLPDDRIAQVAFLANALGKPVLVEGPAGVGKTELAKSLAKVSGRRLIRLQCYEGLDESRALYEWNYKKQLLRIQADQDHDWSEIEGDIFSEEFLLTRPLLEAIRSEEPVVLLIDEIDRVEMETEALLLEVLSDFQVSIPELGTITAATRPMVLLTSNNTRELSEALKRRCLFLHIAYPTPEREAEILRARVPGLAEHLATEIARVARSIRQMDLKKAPSVSETIDWAMTLLALGIDHIDRDVIGDTVHVLLKYQNDIERAMKELAD
jgi:MoxR-like ATPase